MPVTIPYAAQNTANTPYPVAPRSRAASTSTRYPDAAATIAAQGAIYTTDLDRAERVGDRLETGTVFMNRCDYLDPELAWVGVRDSGRGCTLSRFGFDGFTRLKSLHLRHAIP